MTCLRPWWHFVQLDDLVVPFIFLHVRNIAPCLSDISSCKFEPCSFMFCHRTTTANSASVQIPSIWYVHVSFCIFFAPTFLRLGPQPHQMPFYVNSKKWNHPRALTFATTLGFAVTTPVAEAANAYLRLHVLCHCIWRDHRPANSLQTIAIKTKRAQTFLAKCRDCRSKQQTTNAASSRCCERHYSNCSTRIWKRGAQGLVRLQFSRHVWRRNGCVWTKWFHHNK